MIRFVLRFFGLLLLALGFIFLVHDGTKSIADQTLYLSSVGSVWSNIHQSSLAAVRRRLSLPRTLTSVNGPVPVMAPLKDVIDELLPNAHAP